MVNEELSALSVIIFAVTIALLVLRTESNPKERNPLTNSTTHIASMPITEPRTVPMTPPPSEESQKKEREEAMKLITESLKRKREKIDNLFKMRVALDQLEIKGRRILQEATFDRQLQQLVLDQAARRRVHLAPMPLISHAPQRIVETPEAYRTQAVRTPQRATQGQLYQISQIPEARVPAATTTSPIYELGDDMENSATHIALRNFEPEEEEAIRARWINPEPVHERIQHWQRGLQEYESHSRCDDPRVSAFPHGNIHVDRPRYVKN